MMMRIFTIILMLGFGMMAEGKSTYIPKYKSYIHIVNGADTIVVSNSQEDLSLSEASGLFSIRIEHEIVTQEKVKAIKRAKRAAGWMEFSAVMSGMSTAFSNNSLQYMVRSTTTYLTAQLSQKSPLSQSLQMKQMTILKLSRHQKHLWKKALRSLKLLLKCPKSSLYLLKTP